MNLWVYILVELSNYFNLMNIKVSYCCGQETPQNPQKIESQEN